MECCCGDIPNGFFFFFLIFDMVTFIQNWAENDEV